MVQQPQLKGRLNPQSCSRGVFKEFLPWGRVVGLSLFRAPEVWASRGPFVVSGVMGGLGVCV